MTVRASFDADAEMSSEQALGDLELTDAPQDLAAYLRRGIEAIDGRSFDARMARLFLAVDRYQGANGDSGSLLEIGVHHGRSAILMALMTRAGEQAVFLDRFDGRGADLAAFRRNLRVWAPGRMADTVQADSLEIDFVAIEPLRAGVRFAHIDSGGSREAVLNDLRKTAQVLSPGGVIVVESFGREESPEVRDACIDYLRDENPRRLTPVAVGCDKLVLAARPGAERLQAFLAEFGAGDGRPLGGEVVLLGHRTARLEDCEFPEPPMPPGLESKSEGRAAYVEPQVPATPVQHQPKPTAPFVATQSAYPALPLRSVVCRYEHFTQAWYRRWAERLRAQTIDVTPTIPISYRKVWEWAAILHALEERGMLQPGRRAMGFAVGTEQLSSIFASMGVEVVASDLGEGEQVGGWASTNQHAASLQALYHPHQVDQATFERLVSFRPVDMNDLSALPSEAFDFVWSSCAMEHLGNLQKGLDFFCNAMRLLKPGGIAVHTTEYNVGSNDATLGDGFNCIYRRRDLEALDYRLRDLRCGLEPFDFDAGTHRFDLDYDVPPYFGGEKVHIKLKFDTFVCTSFLLIAHKAG